MRNATDIARTFRRLLVKFRYSTTDNWWLRRAVYLVRKWYCILTCEATPTTAVIEVGDEPTLLRYPDLFARDTIITNSGVKPVFIYEDGVIVGLVDAGRTGTFRFTNRFILDGACRAGENTTVTITTNRRCECGDSDPLPYGQVIEPVGGDLI